MEMESFLEVEEDVSHKGMKSSVVSVVLDDLALIQSLEWRQVKDSVCENIGSELYLRSQENNSALNELLLD